MRWLSVLPWTKIRNNCKDHDDHDRSMSKLGLVVAPQRCGCLCQDGIEACGLGWGQGHQGMDSLAGLTQEKVVSNEGWIPFVKGEDLSLPGFQCFRAWAGLSISSHFCGAEVSRFPWHGCGFKASTSDWDSRFPRSAGLQLCAFCATSKTVREGALLQ